jgi:hypothetical protein
VDQNRFDALTRRLSGKPSRRHLLRGLAAAGLGLGAARLPDVAARKHKGKKRRKKRQPEMPTPNEFGCVDVGKACNGDSSLCCSGMCEGTAPKKGKADTSRCVAHDAGICSPGSNVCTNEGVVSCNPSNDACYCLQTTGSAPFCGNVGDVGDLTAFCRICHRDTDCHEEFGPGSACVDLREGPCPLFCADTGDTACVPACLAADL